MLTSYVCIQYRRSDLLYHMSFFRASPALPITVGPPHILWAYRLNLLNGLHIILASHLAIKGGNNGFSAVQILKKWAWQLAMLKASGPMKCAGPLNGYLIASLYGSWCNGSFPFRHVRGWKRGFQQPLTLPRRRWRDLAEALWRCRSAPMDSQGVREVICAQHCP